MRQEIEIKEYDEKKGLELVWESNYIINVNINENEVLISANEEGLISLAKQFLTLAQKKVPLGTHIHLDEYNSLEDGSRELIIEKIN